MADEAPRKGQEGSRWVNERPTGEELAKWFSDNVDLHGGLKHENYVQGITLIPAQEKAKEVIGWSQDNNPIIGERTNMVYIPYAKVETRVKYFHDLMAAKAEEWVGMIEPVEVEGGKGKGLPPGFFSISVEQTKNGLGTARYVCCSMRVRIYKRGTVKRDRITIDKRTGEEEWSTTGEVILDAPPGTKMVAMLNRYGEADPFAIMKAETGAVGRALGLAGMLVVPGTGVATAEDMQEALALEGRPPAVEDGAAAAVDPGTAAETSREQETAMRTEAAEIIGTLKKDHPDAFAKFQEWATGRGIGRLADVDATAMRGLLTKVRRTLAEAQIAAVEGTDLGEEPPPEAEPEAT